MTAAALSGFAPREASDRNFFLLILAGIWGGVIAGFIPDSLDHFTGEHVAYAWIVHVHAVSYVAWLALLTTQMSLIRAGRIDLHRRRHRGRYDPLDDHRRSPDVPGDGQPRGSGRLTAMRHS